MDNTYFPLIALCVSTVLSVAAIVISRSQQHHNQIVSYEQRRQEVRQIFLEGQLLVMELKDEMYRALKMTEELLIDKKISDELKLRIVNGSKVIPDNIANNAVARREFEAVLKELDRLPASPSTQARLDLERLGGVAIRLRDQVQADLERVRDSIQSLEEIVEKFGQRDISK